MNAKKSGIILKQIGERVFEHKAPRDDMVKRKVKEGYFCYPYFRPWPKGEYLLFWFSEAHSHHHFCGGILESAEIEADQRHAEGLTEAEAYKLLASLMASGLSVCFSYIDGVLSIKTYTIKDWRKLPWAKNEEV